MFHEHVPLRWRVGAELKTRRTDLGFTRDRRFMPPKSAEADLGARALQAKRFDSVCDRRPIGYGSANTVSCPPSDV
jgi:hypothetical protein